MGFRKQLKRRDSFEGVKGDSFVHLDDIKYISEDGSSAIDTNFSYSHEGMQHQYHSVSFLKTPRETATGASGLKCTRDRLRRPKEDFPGKAIQHPLFSKLCRSGPLLGRFPRSGKRTTTATTLRSVWIQVCATCIHEPPEMSLPKYV